MSLYNFAFYCPITRFKDAIFPAMSKTQGSLRKHKPELAYFPCWNLKRIVTCVVYLSLFSKKKSSNCLQLTSKSYAKLTIHRVSTLPFLSHLSLTNWLGSGTCNCCRLEIIKKNWIFSNICKHWNFTVFRWGFNTNAQKIGKVSTLCTAWRWCFCTGNQSMRKSVSAFQNK